ncbi:MAG: glycosyltransferase family 4 protein [Bacteroidetes bacterium]|nr:glycosyltransferase family 4 protein [Bacteroidota bacterium]
MEFQVRYSDLVPAAHNEIDIFVNPSVHESFGVSVLEASACENPVVVTNVGGLKEVVVNNSTGMIVEQGNQNELIKAISYFVENREQIDIFGKRGRAFVSGNYDQSNVRHKIKDLYTSFLKSGKQ